MTALESQSFRTPPSLFSLFIDSPSSPLPSFILGTKLARRTQTFCGRVCSCWPLVGNVSQFDARLLRSRSCWMQRVREGWIIRHDYTAEPADEGGPDNSLTERGSGNLCQRCSLASLFFCVLAACCPLRRRCNASGMELKMGVFFEITWKGWWIHRGLEKSNLMMVIYR